MPVSRSAFVAVYCACCAALSATSAVAELADRSKPINLESDRMHVDDAKRTSVFEGKVVLTQGTLSIRADKIIVRQDKDGFQYGSASGSPVVFRQKREGAEGYIQGEAERIEYNNKLDRVEFFNHARLLREPADEVRGNYISYDARTEFFSVHGGATPGAGADPGSRVRAVIQPRVESAPADSAAPGGAKR